MTKPNMIIPANLKTAVDIRNNYIHEYGHMTTHTLCMRLWLDRLLKEAEVKHINFHALRHTFATRCIESGFGIKSLAEILGHTNIAITLRTYTHALEE